MREHTGIALSAAKRELVYGRLSRRLRALRLAGFREYIDLLERGAGPEIEEFINAVTTNLTSFFREPHHFDYLAREFLPKLVANDAGTRRLRIWCCAASTGEEPYSIAMVLREASAAARGLGRQAAGHGPGFRGARDRRAPASMPASAFAASVATRLGRFLRREARAPRQARYAPATPSCARLITFRQLNLMNEWPMRGPFDAIFCRNVIIYFDKATQRTLFERMATLQRAGDLLFLGHSESLYRVSERYELIGRTIYRRLDH